MDGQEFTDINQLLQRVVSLENQVKDSRAYNRLKDSAIWDKEKHNMSYIEGEARNEEDNEICVAEWVETPRDKSISCSFLKPNGGRKDEMKYTFDVPKCDRLFDLLLCGGVIRLTEGHGVPSADMLAKKKYCKWHDSYSYTTNECNYFWQQVQSVINEGRLTLGDGARMKLDTDPFPVNVIEFEQKKVLVRTDQVETTKVKMLLALISSGTGWLSCKALR
jgi:hypothetical protein